MTHQEYLAAVREALSKLDKRDKEAVHKFNEWRDELYKQISKKGNVNGN